MEHPRTDPAQSVPHPHGQPGDPNTEPQPRRSAPADETSEPHWSPFAPVSSSPADTGAQPPAQPRDLGGLNPDTQQQPVVPGPPTYVPPNRTPNYGPPATGPRYAAPNPPGGGTVPGHAMPPGPPTPPNPGMPPGQPMPGYLPGQTGTQPAVAPQSGPPSNAPASAPASAAPASGAPASGPPGPVSSIPGYAPPYNPAPNLPVPYPDQPGSLEPTSVTADDFAQRRVVPPAKPVATTGIRAALRKSTFGLVSMKPGKREIEVARSTEAVRRNFGGLRQITVVNPKGGAGKTVAVLMLAMMFGQRRGGYVLAWDNNETQGTLGMRAQQDFHQRTVRDLLRDLEHFSGPTGRVGDLSQYVRSQGEAMFDVLASDESATAGEMLTSQAFGDIREVVSRFYKLIVVDTGNNVRAANWQSAMDATDQLVITMSARNDSAETAARMLDHLEQSGRRELVRRAVTVVSMPAHRKDLDLPAVQRHFAARTRAVLLAPYEKLLDSGEPIRYGMLTQATREAWLKIAASVASGL